MTFLLADKYNANGVSPSYPVRGSIKNDSSPGAKDGTALDNQWKDDERAIWEILLQNANITPSGFVDTAIASDHYGAFLFAISNDYSVLKNYPLWKRGIGSNGWEYNARTVNGPATSVVNPVGDLTGVWVTAKPEDVGNIRSFYHNPTALEIAQGRLQALDGSSLEKTGYYAALYAVFGDYYGNADASHFYVPDLSGLFERIWDNGAGVDLDVLTRFANTIGGPVADAIGSEEIDRFELHVHTYSGGNGNASWDTPGSASFNIDPGGNTSGVGGNQTNPKSIYKGVYVIC